MRIKNGRSLGCGLQAAEGLSALSERLPVTRLDAGKEGGTSLAGLGRIGHAAQEEDAAGALLANEEQERMIGAEGR